jgi:type VI secretion system protein ImpG
LSIAEGEDAADALREILELYNLVDSDANRAMIKGLAAVNSRRIVGRVGGAAGGFCRGIEVAIELDESKFSGSGAFLFACVLERFFGVYASINSFSQMVARCIQREGRGDVWRWPLRVGDRIAL